MNIKYLTAAVAITLGIQGTTQAGMTVEQRLALLEARTKMLERKVDSQARVIRQKERQIARLEENASNNDNGGGLGEWWQGVTMSGVVEVEAMATDNADVTDNTKNGHDSDINVAKVELGIDARVNNWTNAHLLLLWEEEDGGDRKLTVDEATITIGNSDLTPWSFTAGRLAIPFGAFETNMVTDPLTLNLGETKETVAMVGYESNGFNAAVYAFNGDLDDNNSGNDNDIDNVGIYLGYGNDNIEAGVGWINDIGDSDGMTDSVTAASYSDNVAGVTAYARLMSGGFNVIGEYVTATESFNSAALAYNGMGAKPAAWNLEAGYTFAHGIADRETTLAAGYQQTKQAQALGLPHKRASVALSMSLFKDTNLSFEWIHDKDYSVANGGTGDNANTATAHLAVEF